MDSRGAREEMPCSNCGKIIMVGVTRRGQVNYCPQCARYMRIHWREHSKHKEVEHRTSLWRIVRDPDETWSTHTCLSQSQIKEYATKGYLCKGVAFVHEDTGRTVVYTGRELKYG